LSTPNTSTSPTTVASAAFGSGGTTARTRSLRAIIAIGSPPRTGLIEPSSDSSPMNK
jgi:hypothetical protein